MNRLKTQSFETETTDDVEVIFHGNSFANHNGGRKKPRRSKQAFLQLTNLAHAFLEFTLKKMGLFDRGRANTMDLQVRQMDLYLKGVPRAFDGTTILFMSDFHIGGVHELPDIVMEALSDIDADLCLLGGDFRYCMTGPLSPVISGMKKIMSAVRPPLGAYGVLGNHDPIELAPALEAMGVGMLINSSVTIRKGGENLVLVGVDDPFFHESHDLDQAYWSVAANTFHIFLAHTPQLYKEVEKRKASLYLCGHTHNGQIRLPFLGPVITHGGVPRRFAQGAWRYKDMLGYTGAGIGVSGTTVRFRCPPEVALFTLKCEENGLETD